MTFIEDVLSGRVALDSMDEYRTTWEQAGDEGIEFHDFLGLLWPEYAMWVEDFNVLEQIVIARRRGQNLLEYLSDERTKNSDLEIFWALALRYEAEWVKVTGYRLMLASSVGERSGIALELTRDEGGEPVAEVFEDDDTGMRTFTAFSDQPVPLAAIEWLLTEARARL